MHRRRRTSLALMAATLLAAPLLTACGDDARPGAAAVVGGERITVAQLEAQVGQTRDAQVAVFGEQGYADALDQQCSAARQAELHQRDEAAAQGEKVVAGRETCAPDRATLAGMISERVVKAAADEAGVRPTRKDLRERRVQLQEQTGGTAEQLEEAYLRTYGIPASRIDDHLGYQYRLDGLRQKYAPGSSPEQADQRVRQELVRTAERLGVDISPRYGSWDGEQLLMVAGSDPWLSSDPRRLGEEKAEARSQSQAGGLPAL
ncbi:MULTISPECIES: hypothetical protein [Streptomyces]|uniref:Lipoprotein n=2 Tax=Streptomyces TaxID=1883 RepID=A0A8H9LNZ9_9ACTN|nr:MULTISPECIES: hypothetical protein [Streptomyces]NEE37931.1 hypothetical protein [Streptomyces sp. SID7982]NEE46224.1 hypothetical protein [Streptomyces sp. SID8455]SUO94151.1 Lipoprotein [Streptomyces griseus]GFH63907.1 lipoprotein [Streptomyces rutgersensis]MBL3804871.1 hypothetical protein [Streptomyces sp. BRB081]